MIHVYPTREQRGGPSWSPFMKAETGPDLRIESIKAKSLQTKNRKQ